MNKTNLLASALTVAALCGYFGWAGNAPGATTQAAAGANTQAIVTATTAFLNSLSADQRNKVQFPFTPQKTAAARFKGGMNGQMNFVGEQYGKAVWSNFPVSDVPRPGLRLGSLSPAGAP
jgi:hypothetical protein